MLTADTLVHAGVLKFKKQAEMLLQESGLPWTILRPSRLTDGPYTSFDLNTLLQATAGTRQDVQISMQDDQLGEASRIAVAGVTHNLRQSHCVSCCCSSASPEASRTACARPLASSWHTVEPQSSTMPMCAVPGHAIEMWAVIIPHICGSLPDSTFSPCLRAQRPLCSCWRLMQRREGSIPSLAKKGTVLVLIQQSGRPCWESKEALDVPLTSLNIIPCAYSIAAACTVPYTIPYRVTLGSNIILTMSDCGKSLAQWEQSLLSHVAWECTEPALMQLVTLICILRPLQVQSQQLYCNGTQRPSEPRGPGRLSDE